MHSPEDMPIPRDAELTDKHRAAYQMLESELLVELAPGGERMAWSKGYITESIRKNHPLLEYLEVERPVVPGAGLDLALYIEDGLDGGTYLIGRPNGSEAFRIIEAQPELRAEPRLRSETNQQLYSQKVLELTHGDAHVLPPETATGIAKILRGVRDAAAKSKARKI